MNEPERKITPEHVTDVCKMGQRSECCSFLLMAVGGFECAKGTGVEFTIRDRRDAGTMGAMGDNCNGWAAMEATDNEKETT